MTTRVEQNPACELRDEVSGEETRVDRGLVDAEKAVLAHDGCW